MSANKPRNMRKTLSYRDLINPPPINPEELKFQEKEFEKLEELIKHHRAVVRWNELRNEETKLQEEEKELTTMVEEELVKLREENEKLKQEYNRKRKAISNYQLLAAAVGYAEKLDKFATRLEQYCYQPIPVHMDDEQFRKLSEKIHAYKQGLPPFNQLDKIRELANSIDKLNLEDGFISKFTQQETYQQMKIDTSKSEQNSQQLAMLPEKIKQLQEVLDWSLSKKQ